MPYDSPFMPVVGQWLEKIEQARRIKEQRFGLDAAEGLRFFCGPYQWLYGDEGRKKDRHFRQNQEFDDADDGEIPAPRFQMTVNKVAELVQLFGPVLYHANPVRQVNPREVPLPDDDLLQAFGGDPSSQLFLTQLYQQGTAQRAVDKARAKLFEHYLNYTPDALDLKTESRAAIDEALIKGMGCLWTEVYQPPGGGPRLVGTFYDSVDNLVIDPDAKSLRAAKWIARRRVMPCWEAERLFGLPPDTLRAQGESYGRQAEVATEPDGTYMRATGQTSDLTTYWEVFSKCGLGGRLRGILESIRPELEVYGDYCYVAVCSGCAYPLNVPDQVLQMEQTAGRQEIARRVQWPTPFWADDSWPLVPIAFHAIPEDAWPLSHLSPGMGELKFLNWAYSYVAGKIRTSSRDLIAILEEAGSEIVQKVLHGTDYELIRIKGSAGKTIDQVVQFLSHPNFNADIWRVIEAISEQFDKRVGLTELMYGMQGRQDRSATESATKRDQMSVRPDEMANKVEDAMSLVARQEALAIRWHLTGQDVQYVMGPVGAAMWDKLITPSNLSELLHSLEYRIEAGSVRKPNRDRDAQNIKDVVQTLLPFFEQLVTQSGLVGPFNTVVTQWCDSIDMKSDGLLVPQPQPMAPPAQSGAGNPQPQPRGA